MPFAIVLGSAAGGGYPQWNCNCAVCRLAWAGDSRVKRRSQASVAVKIGNSGWLLLNASPDLRTQIVGCHYFIPAQTRYSAIRHVLLTGAEIDQTAGLLSLREQQAFTLHATAQTFKTLDANPVFGVLNPDLVLRRELTTGHSVALDSNVTVDTFTVLGKVPLFMEGETHQIEDTGVNIGVEIQSGGKRMIFMPGIAALTPAIRYRLAHADLVFFDGTLFTDNEMIASGTGVKTGLRMGHMPIDGPDGSLKFLAGLRGRRIYIHVNNTNPILIDGSLQRLQVEHAGCDVAFDGMEIML